VTARVTMLAPRRWAYSKSVAEPVVAETDCVSESRQETHSDGRKPELAETGRMAFAALTNEAPVLTGKG
jgi:hypothetical protein